MMISDMTFLIDGGFLPESVMTELSIVLSRFWGGGLVKCSSDQIPEEVIDNLNAENGLIQFSGDVAMAQQSGGSWLEALAAWRIPVVLIVKPLPSGQIPGIASAYVALCKELKVPLIGVLQFGGAWNCQQRMLDGLPWCGLFPSDAFELDQLGIDKKCNYLSEIQEIVSKLKRRRSFLGY